jgi:hypothetical protein
LHNNPKTIVQIANAPTKIPFCSAALTGAALIHDHLQAGHLSQVMDQFFGKPFTEGLSWQ